MGKREPEYYREKVKENRKVDKILGERYRGWEAYPGESYSEFKKRFKSLRIKQKD